VVPPSPPLRAPAARRAIGHLPFFLVKFSRYYCAWFGVPFCHSIAPLPFGLLLKWSDGTSLDKCDPCVSSVQPVHLLQKSSALRRAPRYPWAPVPILMTRLPGEELGLLQQDLNKSQRRLGAPDDFEDNSFLEEPLEPTDMQHLSPSYA
jgi:hypothetical protein